MKDSCYFSLLLVKIDNRLIRITSNLSLVDVNQRYKVVDIL